MAPPKNLKKKNSGKSSGKVGQKQCEIREKAMGNSGKAIENSGKSNGKFGKRQCEIRPKAIIFPRNICHRFSSFLIAFAPNFPLLLPEYLIAFDRISHCFFPNFGKSWANAMRKLGKRRDIFRAKIMEVLGNFKN